MRGNFNDYKLSHRISDFKCITRAPTESMTPASSEALTERGSMMRYEIPVYGKYDIYFRHDCETMMRCDNDYNNPL